jgi:mono/diheme cytochrome c family protein
MSYTRTVAAYALAVIAALVACGILFADCGAPRVVVRQSSYGYSHGYNYAPVIVSKPYVAPVVVKKVVVEEVPVVVRYTAVIPLVEYGSYSAVYAPPTPGPQNPALAPPQAQQSPNDMARVLQALEGIGKRLDALERGGKPPVVVPQQAPPQKPDEQPISALQVISAKCASCHSDKVAADKGAGLALIADGKLAEVSARQKNKVIGRSYAGTMPPKDSGIPALTDPEVGAVVDAYSK